VDIPDLATGDFENLTITGQLRVVGQAAGGHPVSLIGSSMGGYLAALYAARHPEVSRVVLLAPAFRFAPRWAERLGADAVAAWRETNALDVFHYGENRQCSLSYALLDDASRYEDYPDFRQPALIFHGEDDDVVPSAYSEEFARRHPAVQLSVLKSGHELLDVLDFIAPRVTAFLASD
jgi:pimeloyl-ACP methyl ester carboxylesterase